VLAEVLEEYLAQLEAGTAPPLEDFVARYPELAADLEACLASLQFCCDSPLLVAPDAHFASPGSPLEGAFPTERCREEGDDTRCRGKFLTDGPRVGPGCLGPRVSDTITTPVKIAKGYDLALGQVVAEVNGIKVKNLRHLVEILRDCKDEYLIFRFAESGSEVLVFRREEMNKATEEILEDNGIRPSRRGSEELLRVWEGSKKP
jgi:hypothetical protein